MKGRLDIPVWMKILILLLEGEKNKSQITNKIKVTYAHVHKTITDLEKAKMVTTKRIGRENNVKLTCPGEIAAKSSIILSKVKRCQ